MLTGAQPASPLCERPDRWGSPGPLLPEGSARNAGSDKRRFSNGKCCPGSGTRQRAAPGLSAAPCSAPSTARRADVHKQDHRDRTIPAAVIVVVLFVAILAAALIWLAAS